MDHIMGTGKVRGCCLLPPMGNGQSIPGSQPYTFNLSFCSFLGQKPSLLLLQSIGVVALAWSRWERTQARGRGRGGTKCVAEDLKMIIYINLRAHGVVAKHTIPPYFEAEINMIKRFFFKRINYPCGKCHQAAATFGEAAATSVWVCEIVFDVIQNCNLGRSSWAICNPWKRLENGIKKLLVRWALCYWWVLSPQEVVELGWLLCCQHPIFLEKTFIPIAKNDKAFYLKLYPAKFSVGDTDLTEGSYMSLSLAGRHQAAHSSPCFLK